MLSPYFLITRLVFKKYIRLLIQTRLPVVLLILFLISIPAFGVRAEISVVDDMGNKISLKSPAKKIVSLAPNLTELLFSAGAGNKIVATVQYSDYPKEAKNILQIGDAHNIDLEALVALMPDLIVTWKSGNSTAIYNKLTNFGFKVYQSEADTLNKISTSILRLGKLAGTEAIAIPAALKFQQEVETLEKQFSRKKSIKVFYQFWDRPIYTINGRHLISHIIELCGGENIYSNLSTLTPQISIESVLKTDPDIIIASGSDDLRPEWLDAWKSWPELKAIQNNQLYFVQPDFIQRHTTRIIQGGKLICEYIDRARL
ncbi:MAG: iron complex transport system substrate-binding protein [Gammaproteobacteria bacterium]